MVPEEELPMFRRVSKFVFGNLIFLAWILLAFGPPAQAQPLGPAFPEHLRDQVSGVVLTPPPGPGPVGPSGAETFGSDVLVNPVTTSAQNETTATTNRWIDNFGVSRFIHNAGANDYRNGDSRCGVYETVNGGASYVDRGLIPLIPSRPDLPVAGDPSMAWGNNGFVYYACLYFKRVGASASDGTIGVSRSLNGGASWTSPVVVANGSASVFNDKEFIAVDTNSRSPFQGRVYICWTEFSSTGARIKFSQSQTRGGSWTAPLTLSIDTVGNQGCDVAVGANGEVYVIWLDGGNNSIGTVRGKVSVNGGLSFVGCSGASTCINVPVSGPSSLSHRGSFYRINNFPRIATGRRGNVFVVFSSTLTYGGVASTGLDIWMWRGTSSLASFGNPVKVNAGRTTRDQHFPHVAVSDASLGSAFGHGFVHVCYLDRSFAAIVGDWDTACTHSHSDGLAGTWAVPSRVSACSSFDNNFGGPKFIGDYISIALSEGTSFIPGVAGLGHVHPYFPRACGGNQDIYSDAGVPAAPPALGEPEAAAPEAPAEATP
jgi:hypothetical protein